MQGAAFVLQCSQYGGRQIASSGHALNGLRRTQLRESPHIEHAGSAPTSFAAAIPASALGTYASTLLAEVRDPAQCP
jgi:hypothetical protein